MSEDRKKEFKERMKTFLDAAGDRIGVVEDMETLPDDAIIVTTTVEDFNPNDNELWDNPLNRSAPRDLYCSGCNKQVVMSHTMFDNYNNMGGKPSMVKCLKCAFKKALN